MFLASRAERSAATGALRLSYVLPSTSHLCRMIGFRKPICVMRLGRYPPDSIMSLIFSAVIRVGKLVLAQGTQGNSEASTTLSPVTPRTRP